LCRTAVGFDGRGKPSREGDSRQELKDATQVPEKKGGRGHEGTRGRKVLGDGGGRREGGVKRCQDSPIEPLTYGIPNPELAGGG